MAAIIESRPHTRHLPPARPALRLITTDGTHTALVPVELGLRTIHLIIAVAVFAALLVGSLAVGNGALAGLAPGPSASGAASASTATTKVTVQAGDSLWSIARRLQPQGEVRPLVDQMVALNGTAPLQAGQVIVAPS